MLTTTAGPAAAARWRDALGPRWRAHLALFAALLFAIGAITTLSDPDLPMHLLTGEWIVHHGVPFREPFAWTRMGAPYFAYSWLNEVVYWLVDAAIGPVGLRLLFGALVALSGWAVWRLGRAAGWRPWTTLFVGLLHVSFAIVTVPGLRPQFVLYVVAPLAWEAAIRLARGEAPRRPLLVAFVASAVAASSHILFPVMLAPAAVFLAGAVRPRARPWQFAAAVVAGWLVSPYALVWPAVFRLNFAPNLLFGRFSPIVEHWPGFNWLVEARSPFAAIILILVVLPWLTVTIRLTMRERLAYGALWLAGLVMFGTAIRGAELWWLIMLPVMGRVIEQLADPPAPRLTTLRVVALYLFGISRVAVGLSVAVHEIPKEGNTRSRAFASPAALETEPLVRWLECRLPVRTTGGIAPDARRVRLFNTFADGSYLAWRLPWASESIDGRTIFPDSVAATDALQMPSHGPMRLGPWRSADLAIVARGHAVAEVLDTASGWRWVAVTRHDTALDPPALGLWVTGRWWRAAGGGALPAGPDSLPPWTGGPATCEVVKSSGRAPGRPAGGRQAPAAANISRARRTPATRASTSPSSL